MMKRLKNWASSRPDWRDFLIVVAVLVTVPVFVKYDNNPKVLEHKTSECNYAQNETEPDIRRGLAERYVKEWGAWWRLDVRLAERIIEAADAQRVPHAIAFALIATESGFDSTAISKAGAIGLAQVRLPTARIYDHNISTSDLQRVDKNLKIGFRYYHDLLHRFDGDVMLALAAYNMGPTAVSNRVKEGRHISMKYSNKVLGR